MVWLAAYVGTIFAANWAVATFGVIPVGLGLMAPAAVLFVGLAFSLRDLVQDELGRRWTVAAIIIGASVSALVSPSFAVASGAAFLFSESVDFVVYTPLRERHWYLAVAASNVAGLVVDSVIFLTLAFGSLVFLPGQILGKLEMTALFVVGAWLVRRKRGALLSRHASA